MITEQKEHEFTEDLVIFWYHHEKDLFHPTETLTRIDTEEDGNIPNLVLVVY